MENPGDPDGGPAGSPAATSWPRQVWRSTGFKIGAAVGLAATIATSLALALTFSGSAPNIPLLNIPLPTFSLQNLVRGTPAVSSASLQAQGAIVLNFWGSWCPPCRAEMPALEAVHRQLGSRVTFVGIDEEDTRPAALSFIHLVGVTYPSGFDGSGAVGQDNFHINGTPTTYFISHGKMLDFHEGRLTKHQLLTYLQQIFGVS
jgi:thiol-disulfide isomerase/thioredoxin